MIHTPRSMLAAMRQKVKDELDMLEATGIIAKVQATNTLGEQHGGGQQEELQNLHMPRPYRSQQNDFTRASPYEQHW